MPSQCDGLLVALARPVFLTGQSQAVRPQLLHMIDGCCRRISNLKLETSNLDPPSSPVTYRRLSAHRSLSSSSFLPKCPYKGSFLMSIRCLLSFPLISRSILSYQLSPAQNGYSHNRPTPSQGDQHSLELAVQCCAEGIQGQQNLVRYELRGT